MNHVFDSMVRNGISYFVNVQRTWDGGKEHVACFGEAYKKKSAISKIRFQEEYPSKCIVLPSK